MPKEGFKSITIEKTTYDKWYKVYQSQKEQLIKKGVNSFVGFIEYKLFQLLDEKEKLRKFVSKIKVVPKEFIEPKIKSMEAC